MQLSRPLDAIDREIIALLKENAKRTFADIGGHVGLSSTAVKRRVDRLEGDGVIVGYGARINPSALGDGIEALIELYCADRIAPADVGRSIAGLDQVVSAWTTSGEPTPWFARAWRASPTSRSSSSGCAATITSCAREP